MSALASLRLVSPGAVTDGVTLCFTSKGVDRIFSSSSKVIKWWPILVIVLQTTVTTRILSTFPGDRLSGVLVNSFTEDIYTFIRVSPPGDSVTRGGPPAPTPTRSCLSINTCFAWCSISLYLVKGFEWNLPPVHKYSSCEWALLKRFSRSEVKGQGHDQADCFNGGGMHFDGVASKLKLSNV